MDGVASKVLAGLLGSLDIIAGDHGAAVCRT